jgi:hypothetical protein
VGGSTGALQKSPLNSPLWRVFTRFRKLRCIVTVERGDNEYTRRSHVTAGKTCKETQLDGGQWKKEATNEGEKLTF